MAHLLEIRDLSVEFDSDDGVVHAVNGVSLHLDAGERLGLAGESGCGKSVTAMSIARLVPSPPGRVVSGSIRFDGEEMLTMPPQRLRQFRGARIGIVFQEPMTALSPLHRIGDQLTEALRLHRRMNSSEMKALALQWLGRVGIAEPARCFHAYPFELSGGMRQRVMIAMALLLEPSLVIADEPTTALDVTIQAQILELLREATAGGDRALLLITHDLGVIWEMCTRVVVMYGSQLMEEAPRAEFFRNPLHPYTRALLDSVPSRQDDPAKVTGIPGSVPSLLQPPTGCPFASRCPRAVSQCHSCRPAWRQPADGHFVACHLVQ